MNDTKYYVGIDLKFRKNGVWRYFLGYLCNRFKTEEEIKNADSECSYVWDFEILERDTFSNDTLLPITTAKKAECALWDNKDGAKSVRDALARYAKDKKYMSLEELLETFFANRYKTKYGEDVNAQYKISKVIIGRAGKTRTFTKRKK